MKRGRQNMNTLLMIDSDAEYREKIRKVAVSQGYNFLEAETGTEGIKICIEQPVDIMVIDIMLPDIDGFSVCRTLCSLKNIPILILTECQDEGKKLFAYDQLGISDYVIKPCSPREIIARLKVIQRYRPRHQSPNGITFFKFDGLEINTIERTVKVDGNYVEFTPKEYDVLFYLVKNINRPMSREHLLSKVWSYDFYGTDRTVDTHIKRLREKLGPYSHFIITLHRVGYKFSVTAEK